VVKGIAHPNPVSWFLWGIASMVAFCAQLGDLQPQSFVTLVLGLTPLIISFIAVARNGLRAHFTPFTLLCGALAVAGIVFWQIADSPVLALLFAMASDILASLPTIHKAYRDPESEYALPYLLSALSMIITLITIKTWAFTIYAFPLYMLGINLFIYSISSKPVRFHVLRLHNRLGLALTDDTSVAE
jgi:hypothetical protein